MEMSATLRKEEYKNTQELLHFLKESLQRLRRYDNFCGSYNASRARRPRF